MVLCYSIGCFTRIELGCFDGCGDAGAQKAEFQHSLRSCLTDRVIVYGPGFDVGVTAALLYAVNVGISVVSYILAARSVFEEENVPGGDGLSVPLTAYSRCETSCHPVTAVTVLVESNACSAIIADGLALVKRNFPSFSRCSS